MILKLLQHVNIDQSVDNTSLITFSLFKCFGKGNISTIHTINGVIGVSKGDAFSYVAKGPGYSQHETFHLVDVVIAVFHQNVWGGNGIRLWYMPGFNVPMTLVSIGQLVSLGRGTCLLALDPGPASPLFIVCLVLSLRCKGWPHWSGNWVDGKRWLQTMQ